VAALASCLAADVTYQNLALLDSLSGATVRELIGTHAVLGGGTAQHSIAQLPYAASLQHVVGVGSAIPARASIAIINPLPCRV
jgi:hypothetical protein